MTESPGPNPPPAARAQPARQENVWLNLLCNAVLPGFLLSFLSKDERLGPVWGLVVSLSLPLGYGIWDLWTWRRVNAIAVLGLVSTLMTGLLGLMKTDGFWIAVKEAALPTLLGIAIPLTLKTRQPLVRTLLYNDQVLDTARVQSALETRGNTLAFERVLAGTSWLLASAMWLSAILNFFLARWLLTGTPGTPEFNAQLGKMNWLSWPIVLLPCTGMMLFALLRLLKKVEALTDLKGDDLFGHGRKPSVEEAGKS